MLIQALAAVWRRGVVFVLDLLKSVRVSRLRSLASLTSPDNSHERARSCKPVTHMPGPFVGDIGPIRVRRLAATAGQHAKERFDIAV